MLWLFFARSEDLEGCRGGLESTGRSYAARVVDFGQSSSRSRSLQLAQSSLGYSEQLLGDHTLRQRTNSIALKFSETSNSDRAVEQLRLSLASERQAEADRYSSLKSRIL
jgi:hypothetical protein